MKLYNTCDHCSGPDGAICPDNCAVMILRTGKKAAIYKGPRGFIHRTLRKTAARVRRDYWQNDAKVVEVLLIEVPQ